MKTHCINGHEFTPSNTIWKHRKGIAPTRRCKRCIAAERRRAGLRASLTKESKQFLLTRADLRRLVDVVWNEATESIAVPSTKWADKLIDRALMLAVVGTGKVT